MALSVYRLRGTTVPLGYVNVPTAGTPVQVTINVDANNVNSPDTAFPQPAAFPGNQTEFTATFRSLHIQAYKPGANNNGLVATSGQVYLMGAPAGNGTGNRNDYRAVIAVIPSGSDYYYPPDGLGSLRFSPYKLWLDVDNNNDGAIVTGYGCEP